MRIGIAVCFLLISIIQQAKADVFVVINNQDSGPGSLRQAITDANNHAGSDKIYFDIPEGDVVSRTITLQTVLPALTGPTVIDATTQLMGNSFGISYARIQLTAEATGLGQAFTFTADSCEAYGFFINKFQNGIVVTGTYSKVGAIQKGNVIFNCSTAAIDIEFTNHAALQGNLIGVDTMGAMMAGATGDGIKVVNSYLVSIGGKTLLAYNVISGNNNGIRLQNATFVDINSNNIGTSPSGLLAQPNAYGIYCTGINNNIEVGGDSLFERNLISGNLNAGIYGVLSNSAIQGNVIGLNSAGEALGNGTYGIYLTFGSSDNLIGGELLKSNVIAKNGQEAIAFQNGTCIHNTITRNSLFCNSTASGNGGIKLNQANGAIASPQLLVVTPTGLAGATIPLGIVEIFTNDSCTLCEGSLYLTTVTANANGVFTYNATISGSVTATVTDAMGNTSSFAGCADTSSSVCIVAEFITTGSKCENQLISFLDQSVTEPSTSVSSRFWNFGDGVTSTSSSPVHAYATPGTFSVKLIAISASGCTDTIVHDLTINAVPNANYNTLPVSCTGEVVHFDDASSSDVTQRFWDFGDGGTSTSTNPSHSYGSPGVYAVTLTVTNASGCTDSKSGNIAIAPQPVAGFTAAVTDLMVSFTNTSSFNGPHSFFWNFDDGNTSTLQNPEHTYANAGTYNVCLSIYDSVCQSGSILCTLIDVVTGVDDLALHETISIYPNPANSYLVIKCGNTAEEIRLTTMEGKNVLHFMNQQALQDPLTLALPALAPGLYLLYVETDKGTIARKVVIN